MAKKKIKKSKIKKDDKKERYSFVCDICGYDNIILDSSKKIKDIADEKEYLGTAFNTNELNFICSGCGELYEIIE